MTSFLQPQGDLLQINSITYARQNHLIFSHLSFTLNSHEIMLIEGNNGSGKTTLMRMIAGLMTPLHGDITWKNIPITKQREPYHSEMHYIGHHHGIKMNLSIMENLKLFCHYHDPKMVTAIEPILDHLSLHQFKNTLVTYLSSGQQRRIALAKLWLLPKKLWLLDEPFVGLDQPTQLLLRDHLEKQLQRGGMIVMTSHQSFHLYHEQKKNLRLGSIDNS